MSTDGQSGRDRHQRRRRAFDAAVELPKAQWRAVVERECGDDAALIEEVLALLRSDEAAGPYLDSVFDLRAEPARERDLTGTQIGAYRVIKRLGEGGAGKVYLAERADGAYERRVAIKLLHPQPQGIGALDRFLRERRILGLLEHPSIAAIVDSGAIDGQPYIAMEYVDGDRIDNYCREKRLSLRERLTLFLDVVNAVQHAHQDTVIHRDLKPGNIFVTHDGRVKLLDFGIGKILSDAERESSDLTRYGGQVLTPDYGAPEQWANRKTSTATDVYALGVVLFKLLSGWLPYDRERLQQFGERGAWPEYPPTMVARVDANPSVELLADRRGLTPRAFRVELGGELQAIVTKTMRPDPADRYGSAFELAADIDNFLNLRPISAQTPTWYDRLGKFVLRNPWPTAFGAAVVLFLGYFAADQALSARAAERQAAALAAERDRAQTVTNFIAELLRGTHPNRQDAERYTVREALSLNAPQLLERFADQPDIQLQLATLVGNIFADLGAAQQAEPFLTLALALIDERSANGELTGEQQALHADVLLALAKVETGLGEYERSTVRLDEAQKAVADGYGEAHTKMLEVLNARTEIHSARNDAAQSSRAAHEALAFARGDANLDASQRAVAYNNWVLADRRGLSNDEAIATLEEALDIALAALPEAHPLVAQIRANLASAFFRAGNSAAAESAYAAVVDVANRQGVSPGRVLSQAAYGLGAIRMREGRFDDALALMQRSRAVITDYRAEKDYVTILVDFALASCQDVLGQSSTARAGYRHVLARLGAEFPDDPLLARARARLAGVAIDLGETAAALDQITALRASSEQPASPYVEALSLMSRTDAGRDKPPDTQRLAELYEEIVARHGPHALPAIKIGKWLQKYGAPRE